MASKIEPRVTSLERRAAQHDREIAAIRKLLLQGAKMLVKLEVTVDRFVRSLERGGSNGRGKTEVR